MVIIAYYVLSNTNFSSLIRIRDEAFDENDVYVGNRNIPHSPFTRNSRTNLFM